jgi:hypothetical protein
MFGVQLETRIVPQFYMSLTLKIFKPEKCGMYSAGISPSSPMHFWFWCLDTLDYNLPYLRKLTLIDIE